MASDAASLLPFVVDLDRLRSEVGIAVGDARSGLGHSLASSRL